MPTLSPIEPKQRVRWTSTDELALLDACEGRSGQQREIVFEQTGAERGIAASSVRSKYYTLRKPKKSTKGRWSKRAQKELLRDVSAVTGRERTAVFEQWAERRGVKVGAIKAKYYSIAPKAPSNGAAEVAPVAPAVASRPVPAVAVRQDSSTVSANAQLSSLTMLELAQLGSRVSEELERRIASVQSLWA